MFNESQEERIKKLIDANKKLASKVEELETRLEEASQKLKEAEATIGWSFSLISQKDKIIKSFYNNIEFFQKLKKDGVL